MTHEALEAIEAELVAIAAQPVLFPRAEFTHAAGDQAAAPRCVHVRAEVCAGNRAAMLPEDVQSIHIHGNTSIRYLHMYGTALYRLNPHEYWAMKKKAWNVVPFLDDILDRSFVWPT